MIGREDLRKTSLFAAAILLSATAGSAGVATIAKAIESSSPSPPSTTSQPPSNPTGTKKDTKKTKPDKSSAVEQFYKGWHEAYALIYDKGDYAGGIAVLRSTTLNQRGETVQVVSAKLMATRRTA